MTSRHLLIAFAAAGALGLAACETDNAASPAAAGSPASINAPRQDKARGVDSGGQVPKNGDAGSELPAL